jgi:AcrR family transcriptional regulator
VNVRSLLFANGDSYSVCPRRRSIDDQTIAEHACRLLLGQGPEAVTFAQVSQACGLAPPTLVQRFGTREGVLVAVAAALLARAVAVFGSPPRGGVLAGLRAALTILAPELAAAVRLSAEVGLAAYALELRKQISYALAAAVDAGELPHCDVAELARTLQISAVGAVTLALLERGDPAGAVGLAVDAQLASYI